MASREQIESLIGECWAYFKTTKPSPQTIESWSTELIYMDLYHANSFILNKFKNLDDFPKNFPKAIRTIYNSWLVSQPKEYKSEKGCSLCMVDEGLIHAKKKFGRYFYTFAFRCGHCKTSDLPYPEVTREWLADNGYILDWQHDFKGGTDNSKKKRIIEFLNEQPRHYSEPEPIPF